MSSPVLLTQEAEEAETADDAAFINDADPHENHSQGDGDMEAMALAHGVEDEEAEGEEVEGHLMQAEDFEGFDEDPPNLYTPGKCMHIIGHDPETGEDVICGDACNPAEQLCHWCRTNSHRMTDMF